MYFSPSGSMRPFSRRRRYTGTMSLSLKRSITMNNMRDLVCSVRLFEKLIRRGPAAQSSDAVEPARDVRPDGEIEIRLLGPEQVGATSDIHDAALCAQNERTFGQLQVQAREILLGPRAQPRD